MTPTQAQLAHHLRWSSFVAGAASVQIWPQGRRTLFEGSVAEWNSRVGLRQRLSGKPSLECLDAEVRDRTFGQVGFFLLAMLGLGATAASAQLFDTQAVAIALSLCTGLLLVAPTVLLPRFQARLALVASGAHGNAGFKA